MRTNIDGTLDLVFPIAPSGTIAAQVNLVALQANGDILVAGSFSTAQAGISNFCRFTPQGVLDTSFNVVLGGSFGPNSAGVTAIAVQPNGQILIGGNFISVQGTGAAAPVTRNHIARLNSDGSLDLSFNPNANAQIAAFALTPDGHIVIGGAFTSLQPNGATAALPLNHVALLNSDGTTNAVFDSSGNYVSGFNPNVNNLVSCIALQPDGKIIIAGAFSLIQANGAAYPSSQQFIARLNPDGTYDSTYQAGTPTSILAMVMQPNGQVVVGGNFTALQNGGATNINVEHIGRINADGSTDLNYSPNANFTVSALAIQADGKVIAGGAFTQFHPAEANSPTYRNGVARINIDGTIDSTFDPNAYGGVGVIVAAPNGQYLIGGSFTSVGGATATNVARLNANGTVDPTFDPAPNGPIDTIAVQSNGQILIGGNLYDPGRHHLLRCSRQPDPERGPAQSERLGRHHLQPESERRGEHPGDPAQWPGADGRQFRDDPAAHQFDPAAIPRLPRAPQWRRDPRHQFHSEPERLRQHDRARALRQRHHHRRRFPEPHAHEHGGVLRRQLPGADQHDRRQRRP